MSKEEYLMAAISNEYDHFFAITLERIQAASQDDETVRLLVQMIDHGFPITKSSMPTAIIDFWEVRHRLSASDGIVFYDERIVVPEFLQAKILWARRFVLIANMSKDSPGCCTRHLNL